jgi:hypothetical protein
LSTKHTKDTKIFLLRMEADVDVRVVEDEFVIFLGELGVDCQNVTPLNHPLITP